MKFQYRVNYIVLSPIHACKFGVCKDAPHEKSFLFHSSQSVPCSLEQTIMTFHTSLPLVTFSASVTRPTFSHFSHGFPMLRFLRLFQFSQDAFVSLFSSHG